MTGGSGKDIAVAVIHGIGSQTGTHYADPLILGVQGKLAAHGYDADRVAWETIYWQDLVEQKQADYLAAVKATGTTDLNWFRKFVVHALGDATAYRNVPNTDNSIYRHVHGRVTEQLVQLYENDLGRTEKPLIVLAHSLGGHIMSNYIWDMQKGYTEGGNAFEGMQWLAGMITFGCNIPLFTFACEHIIPIGFPGAALPDDVRARARWLNYYDANDILGFPLKCINGAYDEAVDQDIPIRVGSLRHGVGPWTHRAYWYHDRFFTEVADFLVTFLED